MAEGDNKAPEIESDDPEETPGYKPPVEKSLKEIQEQDQDDESLVRYKQMLLAGAGNATGNNFDKNFTHMSKSILLYHYHIMALPQIQTPK